MQEKQSVTPELRGKNGKDGPDDHKDTQDRITIFVNGHKQTVDRPELGAQELVKLAGYDVPPDGDLGSFTITYKGGPGSNPEGILKDGNPVKIQDGMEFNIALGFAIIVNKRQKTVLQKTLSSDDLVHLAYQNPPTGPDVEVTIIYKNGPKENQEGSLKDGGKVMIQNGMRFNVTVTDKS